MEFESSLFPILLTVWPGEPLGGGGGADGPPRCVGGGCLGGAGNSFGPVEELEPVAGRAGPVGEPEPDAVPPAAALARKFLESVPGDTQCGLSLIHI